MTKMKSNYLNMFLKKGTKKEDQKPTETKTVKVDKDMRDLAKVYLDNVERRKEKDQNPTKTKRTLDDYPFEEEYNYGPG